MLALLLLESPTGQPHERPRRRLVLRLLAAAAPAADAEADLDLAVELVLVHVEEVDGQLPVTVERVDQARHGAVAGRVASGVVSDRIGTFTTIRLGYALQLAALVALLGLSSREALLGSLLVLGVGFAASDTMLAKAVPDVFGRGRSARSWAC